MNERDNKGTIKNDATTPTEIKTAKCIRKKNEDKETMINAKTDTGTIFAIPMITKKVVEYGFVLNLVINLPMDEPKNL